jgi:hypothetical protein
MTPPRDGKGVQDTSSIIERGEGTARRPRGVSRGDADQDGRGPRFLSPDIPINATAMPNRTVAGRASAIRIEEVTNEGGSRPSGPG